MTAHQRTRQPFELTHNALGGESSLTRMLGWHHPRKVVYIHRHSQLMDRCLYLWDHQQKIPLPTASQDLIFLLEDIYVEARGGFKAQKLIMDVNLGVDGSIRMICGINTTCASSLLSSLCALSPVLLLNPLTLRLRPGGSHGVVMPALFVDDEWVDGRPMARDEQGKPLPSLDLLTEVQTLLRHGKAVEMLPHQIRYARRQTA